MLSASTTPKKPRSDVGNANARKLVADLAMTLPERTAIPEPFDSWVDSVAMHWPSAGATTAERRHAPASSPQSAFLAYGLFCRSLILSATGNVALQQLTWLLPDYRPPLAWLDDLASHRRLEAFDDHIRALVVRSWGDELVDVVRPVYEKLLPASVRRPMGEFYTPEWLADHVVGRIWNPDCRWLDPSVGSGAFLLALARKQVKTSLPISAFVGIDCNPWAVLAATANAALAASWSRRTIAEGFVSPIVLLDLVKDPAPDGLRHGFNRVIGNPPWVLWDRLDEQYLRETALLWQHYGLMVDRGLTTILGGGKKDLAMLIAYVAADQYLHAEGKLALVITQSVFKSTGSARGFRRWRLPDGTPLGAQHVDDLAGVSTFSGSNVKTAVLVATKGIETQYPVPYHVWKSKTSDGQVPHIAEPADSRDPLSAWRHVDARLEPMLERVLGPCFYQARLGVNTGGANGIYWFEKTGETPDGFWRLRNLAHRAKRPLPTVETLFEPQYLYPCLIGKDVRAWSGNPSAWILLVQDFDRRRGIDRATLEQNAPKSLAYLDRFEENLRRRAAFRRYFQRRRNNAATIDAGPFYSMFDVGRYSLAPVKVVWNRMGSRLAAAVVAERDGKPIQPQETHAMFPLDDIDEAFYLASLLNSRWAQWAIEAVGQVGGKSFATPKTIQRLRLERFDRDNPVHRELATLARCITEDVREQREPTSESVECLNRLAASYWRLDSQWTSQL